MTYAGVSGGTVSSLTAHGMFLNSDTSGNVQTANTLTLVGTISLSGTAPAFLNVNGPVIVTGGGLLDVTAFSELAMGATASLTAGTNGTVLLGNSYVGANNATFTADGGTVRHAGPTVFTSFANAGENFYINNGGLTVDTQGFNTTYPMNLLRGNSATSIGGLTKLGSGTLTLSGTNTYQGTTLVEAGTLIATNSMAIADGTNLTVGNPSQFAPAPVVSPGTAAGSAITPVPEPGTLMILVAASIIALFARRR